MIAVCRHGTQANRVVLALTKPDREPSIRRIGEGDEGQPVALPTVRLTPRQCDILACVSRGLTNKEIGRELGISHLTVRTHLVHLFQLLGVRSRNELANRRAVTSYLKAASPSADSAGNEFTGKRTNKSNPERN